MSKMVDSLVSFLHTKRYMKWRILAVMLIALVLTSRLAIWFVLNQTNSAAAEQNFGTTASQQIHDIQDQFEAYANTLYAARALFLTEANVSRQDWDAFVDAQQLSQRYPAFYALGYISVINQADVASLTSQLNANRLPGETKPIVIQPLNTGDTLDVLTYIAPSTASQANIGYNALADPARAKALAESRDSGLLQASKPLTVIADPDTGYPSTIFVVLPIYMSSAASLQTIEQRQAALQGYVVLAVRIKPLLDEIFTSQAASGLTVAITTNGQTIYQHGIKPSGTILEKRQEILVAKQTWTLDFKASSKFSLSPAAQMAPTALSLSALPFLFTVGLILYFATRVYQPAHTISEKSDLEPRSKPKTARRL